MIKYEILTEPNPVLAIVDRVRSRSHPGLENAVIAVAFARGMQPDADGHYTLGKMRRVSALDKGLHGHDFVMVLNADAWDGMSARQRTALVDHELQHAAPVLGESGDQVIDLATGRRKWRIRRHDVEEFTAVVARNGITSRDLETMAAEIARRAGSPLFSAGEPTRDLSGIGPDPGEDDPDE